MQINNKSLISYEEEASTTAAAAVPAFALTPASPAPTASAATAAPCLADLAATPADEDTFVLPPAWQRHRYARRGSSGVVTFTPDPKARALADEEIKRVPNQVKTVLEAAGTDRAVRLAGFAWRDGDRAAPPVGAAAVAVAAGLGKWSDLHRVATFADLWIAERGLLFAVEAAAEAMAMRATEDLTPGTTGRRYCLRAMGPGDFRHGWQADVQLAILFRARQALAAAPAEEYAAALALLDRYRAGSLYARVAASVLAPARADWVERDIAEAVATDDHYLATALIAAVGDGAQLAALAPAISGWPLVHSFPLLTTLLDGTGAACAPHLFTWYDEDRGADGQKRLLSAIAALPGDDVMTGLIERVDAKYVTPALLEAAERYPSRALRLFAEAGGKRAIADLLSGHLATHPELFGQVRPRLSAAAAARVEAIAGAAAAVTFAPAEAVPPLLASPPWLRRAKAAKPVVVPGLTATDTPTIGWLPGEREAWRETQVPRWQPEKDWPGVALRLATGRARWYEVLPFFAEAPEAVARPLLGKLDLRESYDAGPWMRVVAARFELDALPALLKGAGHAPTEIAGAFLPFTSPEIAVHMADWLARLKTVRRVALAWLLRHPAEAARALVPPALGKAGTPRRTAERALLALHTNGHTAAVRAAAGAYGIDAEAAIETLLSTDPLMVLPARIPPNPAWAVPGMLPPIELRGGLGALPAEAVAHVVTVLALSRMDDPYAGMLVLKEVGEPESLAEFAWQLFQRWQAAGASAKESWVLDALGLLGDDETVRRLTPLILAWPGEGGHARAVTGVGVLAAIGTDVALMHLHGIAQRAKFKGLKTAAQQKMDEVAAGLGLDAEQLADRLVPDFGLAADGSLRLDYGPRQFLVGFDEQLRPFVADADGKRLKALPKPGARDDAELAPAAYKQFAALKKDVRTVATDVIRRLERAMVTGRRWSGAEFRQLFVGHPLLWHIVRRLVWGVYDADDAPLGAIRVAEDRSFATATDDETGLADDAIVGVAHPLRLGDALGAWSELFADYEILQPFPQLNRPTFALTPEEAAKSSLARFEGRTVPTTKLLGLERRGWRREQPQDGGVQGHFELVLGPRLEMAVALDPGIVVGLPTEFPEQKLTGVFLHNGHGTEWGREGDSRLPLSRLDPVAASEIIRDLTDVIA